jgi:hypothetical protein
VEARTLKLALFESKYGTVFPSTGETDNEYTRVSEHIEVTFMPLPQDELIRGKLNMIDNEINEKFAQIETLKQRKQELLALEHIES